MYEDMTYEVLLNSALSNVPDSVDKREGSVIYDAIAPACQVLADAYIQLDNVYKETFASTSSRDYLVKRAAERGLYPSVASAATLLGNFTPTTVEIPTGARFSCGNLNYTITSYISAGKYQLTCDTPGVIGNTNFGALIPIDYIDGLETAVLTSLLVPGEDDEDVESLRERYFSSFNAQQFGGNQADYINKTISISGVGSVKVTPVWNGGGSVKLTILDSTYNIASQTLIDNVQNVFDPDGRGNGIGLAPIGHVVTVDTAIGVNVNVSTSVTCSSGYTFDGLKSIIIAAIESYFLSLRTAWANADCVTVRISQIENKILSVTGIQDITNTKLNGNEDNLTLGTYEVPILGEVVNN